LKLLFFLSEGGIVYFFGAGKVIADRQNIIIFGVEP